MQAVTAQTAEGGWCEKQTHHDHHIVPYSLQSDWCLQVEPIRQVFVHSDSLYYSLSYGRIATVNILESTLCCLLLISLSPPLSDYLVFTIPVASLTDHFLNSGPIGGAFWCQSNQASARASAMLSALSPPSSSGSPAVFPDTTDLVLGCIWIWHIWLHHVASCCINNKQKCQRKIRQNDI